MAFVTVGQFPIISPVGPGGLCPVVGLSVGGPSLTLSASLTGALALNASFSATPPTYAIYLAALEELYAELSLGVSLGVPSCSFGADVSAGIAVNADIEASLNASLSLYLPSLLGLLSASIGVYAFTYVGPASGLGATLTTELASTWPDGAPTSGPCDAIILLAPTAAANVLLAFLNGLGTPGPGLEYVTKLSAISQLSLATAAAMPQAEAAINASLSACASINATLTPQVSVPLPTLAVTGEAVANVTLPSLRAALSRQAPSVGVVLDATASLAADINANFGAMASLGLILGRFDALFGLYTYSGTGTAFGAAVTAGITSPAASTAIVLAATDSISYGVLTGFFGAAA
jgi:hypothetical protein